MTEQTFQLVTDKQGVRDFRNLRKREIDATPQAHDPRLQQGSIVVDITTEITSNDPVEVNQVTLVNGSWQLV